MSSIEYAKCENLLLKEYNSMRLKVYADLVYMPYTLKGVLQVFENHEKYVFLGEGSNTIFSQERCATPVIISHLLNSILYDGNSIIADCGVKLSRLAWFALEHSIPGFEYLEDIPGSIGGALCMNAGTYDDCIGKQVESVMIYDFVDRKVKTLYQDQLSGEWGKRESYFQNHPCYIIQCRLDASNKGNYLDILECMLNLKRTRYAKQPRDYPSAGSVFKRPYKDGKPVFVWKLLDEAGLRGYRIGDAQISEKHPGFIINMGDSTGAEIIALMNHCKKIVSEKYGVDLKEEWKIV